MKSDKILATAMIKGMRKLGICHLLSNKCNEWQSAYLNKSDIRLIETLTNKKVKCSPESGEYFYKLN